MSHPWEAPTLFQERCNVASLTPDGDMRWLKLVVPGQRIGDTFNQFALAAEDTTLTGTTRSSQGQARLITCVVDDRVCALFRKVNESNYVYFMALNAHTGAVEVQPQLLTPNITTASLHAWGVKPGPSGGIVVCEQIGVGSNLTQKRHFIAKDGTYSVNSTASFVNEIGSHTSVVSKDGDVATLWKQSGVWQVKVNDGSSVVDITLPAVASDVSYLLSFISDASNSIFVRTQHASASVERFYKVDLDAGTSTALSAAGRIQDVNANTIAIAVRESGEELVRPTFNPSGSTASARVFTFDMTKNNNDNVTSNVATSVADTGGHAFRELFPESRFQFRAGNVDADGTFYCVVRTGNLAAYRPMVIESDGTASFGDVEDTGLSSNVNHPQVLALGSGKFVVSWSYEFADSEIEADGTGPPTDQFEVWNGLTCYQFDSVSGTVTKEWEWRIFGGLLPYTDASGNLYVWNFTLMRESTPHPWQFDDEVWRRLDVQRLS